MTDEDHRRALEQARVMVGRAESIVVLSGAGISTDSGIPDFRGPNGVWTKNPAAERLSTIDAYLDDPEVRRRSWAARVDAPASLARPNAGHRALVELERAGRLQLLVTQNVDGLHLDAGHDPDKVVEIHGSGRQAICLSCGDRQPMEQVTERVRGGDVDPRCQKTQGGRTCEGILKAATISFGQSLVPEDVARSESAVGRCDLLLCVGTSLGVYPAAGLVPRAVRAGAAVIIVNGEPTPYDDVADVVVGGSISEVLPVIVGAPA